MSHSIPRRLILLGMSAATLAACAPGAGTNPLPRDRRATLRIADFTIETEGASFESRQAANRSSALAPDLRAALQREFRDRMAEDGLPVVVTISRLNVAGGTATAFGRDQSRLQGSVRVLERDGSLLASYTTLTVAGAARESRTGALVGAAIDTADGFYRALLTNFARQSREEMLGADLPGARTVRRIGGALSD